ncbi:hypothetical protein EDD15DRAFT_2517636 [Pisolithus albus]|nr:hypothetical protein EDD15DRAFT_2517636 [Pisolithus albus]
MPTFGVQSKRWQARLCVAVSANTEVSVPIQRHWKISQYLNPSENLTDRGDGREKDAQGVDRPDLSLRSEVWSCDLEKFPSLVLKYLWQSLQLPLLKSHQNITHILRVREEQREKARLRAARNRTRKRIVEDETTTRNPTSTTLGVSPHTESDSYLHPLACSELPSLKKVRQLIADWKSEWGVESTWPKKFHEQLRRAQGDGRLATDLFFSQCEVHVEEGRQLVWLLRSITRKGFRGAGYKVTDSYEQVCQDEVLQPYAIWYPFMLLY